MKKFIILPILAMLAGCADVMSTTGAFTIETFGYSALTTESVVLKHPCTTTVTTYCVDATLAQTLSDSRTLLVTALNNYKSARKAYYAAVAAGTSDDGAAVTAAYSSLQDAITSANSVLALTTVQSILSSIGE